MPPDPVELSDHLIANGVSGVAAKGRRFVDQDFIETFQSKELLYYVWTINPLDRISHYTHLGVDGIITDFPDRMQK